MEDAIELWALDCRSWSPTDPEFNAFVNLLPVSERNSVLRYIMLEDRKRAVVSRLLQRKLVHTLFKIPYDDIVIKRTKEGKPYLDNMMEDSRYSKFNFNVAHHGNYVVLVSDKVRRVGVDIMSRKLKSEEPLSVFFKPFCTCFTPNEWKMVWSAGASTEGLLDQFYRLWCLKEAYIKALGVGLGFDLQRIEFFYPNKCIWSTIAYVRIDGQEQPNWRFHLSQLEGNHWVCVARGPVDEGRTDFEELTQQLEIHPSPVSPEISFKMIQPWELIPDSERPKFQHFAG